MPLSTSSSSHRAPLLNYPVQLIAAAVAFLILALPLCAVNYYVDPFNVGDGGLRADIDRQELYRRSNTALWAVASIDRALEKIPEAKTANIVVIGDSRSRALTGEWTDDASRYVEDGHGNRVFNLAYGGATVEDAVDVFRHYRKRFPELETVLWGTNFDELLYQESPGQLARALNVSRNPLEYYLSFRTLGMYVNDWEQIRQAGRQPSSNADWSVQVLAPPNEAYPPKPSPLDQKWTEMFPNGVVRANAVQLRTRTIEAKEGEADSTVRTLMAPLVSDYPDLEFAFIIMPLHPFLEHAVVNWKTAHYRSMTAALSRLGLVYDYSLYDEEISVFEFKDSAHTKNGEEILADWLRCAGEPDSYKSRFAYDGMTPCLN